jgi:undecaprenyl-diphosphatase
VGSEGTRLGEPGKITKGLELAFGMGLLEALEEQAAEQAREHPHWQEEARLPAGDPAAAIEGDPAGRHEAVRVVSVAVIGYLAMVRKRSAALLVFVAVGGGLLLSMLLKHTFERVRPDLVPHGVRVYTASFPSSHAMLSAVTYLTLGALLTRVEPRRRLKAYLLTVAVLLTLLIGTSRVYLGVHWPTDVLAGWCVGSAWATLCWLVAQWPQRKGRVEPDREQADCA